MNKSNYHQYAGHIISGPSRELLFDSLRLGSSIRFEFVFTNGTPESLKAVVTAIKKKTPIVASDFDNWIIELRIISNKSGCKKKLVTYNWIGHYSTSLRDGEMTGVLPVCLISK